MLVFIHQHYFISTSILAFWTVPRSVNGRKAIIGATFFFEAMDAS
jgi:hypothetical protein